VTTEGTVAFEETGEEVKASQKRLYEAAMAADAEAIDELLSEDVGYFHSDGHRDDKSGFRATVAKGSFRNVKIDFAPAEVWLVGEAAVVAGTVTATRELEDGVVEVRENSSLDVWRRRDGRWQLLAHHLTPLPSARPA
jgi:uncharacterized protein (TIGR02246 family)